MVAHVSTVAYLGLEARGVEVQVQVAPGIPAFVKPILLPVEVLGLFTKPIALCIRLFANMTAGHIVVLAFIGLILTFKSLASGAPFLMAIAIMLLEVFVAFLQAFIFSLLASVFIGQMRTAHH